MNELLKFTSTIFLFLNFFSLLFDLPPKFPRHTCGPFASAAPHRLKIAGLDYITSNGRMIDELEGTWKEAISILFEILRLNFSGGTERNHDKSNSG
jgi:hypothetical protein